MDITNFMTWFISQIISMFTNIFNILDNITFSGVSILKLIIAILIINTFIPIIFTINKDIDRVGGQIVTHNEKVRRKNEKEYNKAQGK